MPARNRRATFLDKEVLQRALSAAGVELSPETVANLARYVQTLLAWSDAVDLTGEKSHSRVIQTLIIASLDPIRVDLSPNEGPLLDVGSGGGSPAIPLALIWPHVRVTCVEAHKRKAAFLTHAAGYIPVPNLTVEPVRAEDLARDEQYRGRYEVVTSRAAAPIARACELTLPFARPGGRVWLYSSEQDAQKLTANPKALAQLGGGPAEIHRLSDHGHTLVVIPKVTEGAPEFPRTGKLAERKPLF